MATPKKIGLEPLNGGILLERMGAEKKTAGGIIIPEQAQEKATKGTVLAVYADVDLEDAPPVDVGDVVLFGKYAGTDLDVDGKDCVLVKKEDLLARVVD